MITKKSFDESAPAMEAMRSLINRGLSQDQRDPLREFVGGSYEQAIEYARVEREKYVAEVGKRDGNYVYHFWPRTPDLLSTFGEKLGDALLSAFKYPERVSMTHDEIMRCFEGEETAGPADRLCRFWGEPADFLPVDGDRKICPNCHSSDVRTTQDSWAVKVSGYAGNPLADDLATSVFDALDRALE